jgi:formyl-CoA transferase
MLAYTDPQWRKFWDVVGRPELAREPRFVNLSARSKNIAELYSLTGECLTVKTTDEWLSILRELEIPSARISSLDDLFNDPHLASVGFFKSAKHPTEGDITLTQLPYRFAGTPTTIERLQPKFAEHSVEVLRELGVSEPEIRSLLTSRATADGRKTQSSTQGPAS